MQRFKGAAAAAAMMMSAGLGLAGCGSDEKAGDSPREESIELASDRLSKDDFADRIAEAQLEAGSGHLEMEMGEAAGGFEAEGDLAFGDDGKVAMSMTMDTPEGAMTMLMVDGTLFMDAGGLGLGEASDAKWLAMDLDDPEGPFADLAGMGAQMDPSAQIKSFEKAMSSFEQKGDAVEIGGVVTTPYVVTIDPSKIEGLGDAFAEAGASAGDLEPMPVTLYVGNKDDLPYRITMDFQGDEMVMNMSDWGKKVSVTAPAESEVVDFAELMGQVG